MRHLINKDLNEEKKNKKQKDSLLASPQKLDKYIGGIAQQLSPSKKVATSRNAASLVDRVDKRIDADHPLKGFGPQMRGILEHELAADKNKNFSVAQITQGVTKHLLSKKDDDGVSKLELAYRMQHVNEESTWMGKDESLKPPLALPGTTPYVDWKKNRMKYEDSMRAKEYEDASYLGDIAKMTAGGTAVGLGLGLLGGPFAPITVPGGMASGAITGALSEAVFWLPRQAVESTRWAKSKNYSGDWGDKAIVMATEFGPELLAGFGIEKVVNKALLKRGVAVTKAIAKPTAENVIQAKDAVDEAGKVIKKAGKKGKEMVGTGKISLGDVQYNINKKTGQMTVKDSKTIVKAALPDDVDSSLVEGAAKRFRTLDEQGMQEALDHEGGLLRGIEAAKENTEARKFMTGEKTSDTVKSERAPSKKKGKKGKTETSTATKASKEALTKKTPKEPVVTVKKASKKKDVPEKTTTKDLEKDLSTSSDSKDIIEHAVSPTSVTAKTVVSETKPIASAVEETSVTVKNARQAVKKKKAKKTKAMARELQKDTPEGKIKLKHTTDEISAAGKKADEVVEASTKEHEALDAVDNALHTDIDWFGGAGEGLTRSEAKSHGIDWSINASKMSAKGVYTEAKNRSIAEVYYAVEDFEAQMFKKYIPDVNPLSNKVEDIRQLPKQRGKLFSAMTKKENQIYDNLLLAHEEMMETSGRTADFLAKSSKEVREAGEKAAKDIADEVKLSPYSSMEQFADDGRQIAKAEQAGDISPKEALNQFNRMERRAAISTKITQSDKNQMLDVLSPIIQQLKGKAGITGFMAAFGVSSGVFNLFQPAEAEAGIIGSLAKRAAKSVPGLTDEAAEEFMTAMQKSKHIVPNVAEGQTFLAEEGFQTGLGKYAPMRILREGTNLTKHAKKLGLMTNAGPYQKFNILLNLKEGLMNNPAVHKASYMIAEVRNTRNAYKVFDNMFKEAGVEDCAREVGSVMESLVPLQKKQIAFEFHTDRAVKLEKQLEKLRGKKVIDAATEGDIKIAEQTLAMSRTEAKKLTSAVADYHKSWDEAIVPLAEKHKGVRFFLAAEDTVDFKKHSFLKNMEFSESDKLFIAKYKRQMAEYRVRLTKGGHKTRSGEYVHYVLHPKTQKNIMAEIAGDTTAAPYLKNYTRTKFSRPLMPDITTATAHYIPDVERRIQNQAFWNAGWAKIEKRLIKTGHYEITKAFDELRQGVKPFENTWGNKAALAYTNMETFNRLFLNPSAGFKHLVKLTGDMASVGVVDTAKALPTGLKGVTWRMADFHPGIKKALKAVGYKGPKSNVDKLRKEAYNSFVPAMDTHFRLQQMGFDIPLDTFNRFTTAASKVTNAGSVWINLAELVDRGVSFEAGMRMAAKRGMTADQATYGIYDLILKNNFLGREFTPSWLKNPKTKALLLFQTTPAKIFERRVANAMRSNRAITKMGRKVFKETSTAEGRAKLYEDLMNIRTYMKGAEKELKSNIFVDALRNEADFFGTPAVKQFARDLLIMGAGTMGGAGAGVNLWHHFFHVPFLKGATHDTGTIALSPAASGLVDQYNDYAHRDDIDDYWTLNYINRWLGPSGAYPDIVWKVNRITKNDIPEIYQDSKFKYLFALPSTIDD